MGEGLLKGIIDDYSGPPVFRVFKDPIFHDPQAEQKEGSSESGLPFLDSICWKSKEKPSIYQYGIITGGRAEGEILIRRGFRDESLHTYPSWNAVFIYDPPSEKVFNVRSTYKSFLRDVQWRPPVINLNATFKERFALTVGSLRR
jgi:hypothetical protein